MGKIAGSLYMANEADGILPGYSIVQSISAMGTTTIRRVNQKRSAIKIRIVEDLLNMCR